jgi:hypothetical protein
MEVQMYQMIGWHTDGIEQVCVDSWDDVLMMMAWLTVDMYRAVLVRNAHGTPVIEMHAHA